MTQLTIDKKKYILISEKEYHALRVKAARKSKPAKKLSLASGKKLANKLIDEWAKEG